MQIFYNIFIQLYSFYIWLASPINRKAKKWIDGRKNLFLELSKQIVSTERYIWFHVSSLGEFEQGKPIMESVRKDFPEHRILLSFFSPSGYEVIKNNHIADIICYLPTDSKVHATRFINLLKPELAVFVKYDFWFNYLQELQKKRIPTIFVSSIFRKEQYLFKPYGKWFLNILKGVDHYFVQNKSSEILLKSFGIFNCTVSGDTRFERVIKLKDQKIEFPFIDQFKTNNKLFIAGSTWFRDEELLLDLLKEKIPGLKVIVVPHETDATHINSLISRLKGLKTQRYSTINNEILFDTDVLIIDTIGMLSRLYRYATFSYVGGGFGKGIHNILEAAAFGIPVIFGPIHQKFKEAEELLLKGGAFEVNNKEQLKSIVLKLMTDQEFLKKSGQYSAKYIEDGIGANDIIMRAINKIL